MSGFLNSIGYVHPLPYHAHHLPTRSRLRAPKRSPTTPTNTGFFEPLPSPGVDFGTLPPSPGPRPLYLCQPFVKAALVKGSFKTIVAPPKYVDVNEWVAINREYQSHWFIPSVHVSHGTGQSPD
jgi:hypothetical protein